MFQYIVYHMQYVKNTRMPYFFARILHAKYILFGGSFRKYILSLKLKYVIQNAALVVTYRALHVSSTWLAGH